MKSKRVEPSLSMRDILLGSTKNFYLTDSSVFSAIQYKSSDCSEKH